MFGKTFDCYDFIESVVVNGFFAFLVAPFFYVILSFIFAIALMPASVILGDEMTHEIIDFVGGGFGYKVAYIIVFIALMKDE